MAICSGLWFMKATFTLFHFCININLCSVNIDWLSICTIWYSPSIWYWFHIYTIITNLFPCYYPSVSLYTTLNVLRFPVFLSPSLTNRRPSGRFPWHFAARWSWGIRQGCPRSPRSVANGYHLQGCPPVAPGNQGSDPRPEDDLAICQPQLQQPFQPGELGRWVSVCWTYVSITFFRHREIVISKL